MWASVQLEEGRERHVRFEQGRLELLVYPHGIALQYRCKKVCIDWEEFTRWFTEPQSKPKYMCCRGLDCIGEAKLGWAEIESIPLRDSTESPNGARPPANTKAYVRFRIRLPNEKRKRGLYVSKKGVHYSRRSEPRTWCDLMQLVQESSNGG